MEPQTELLLRKSADDRAVLDHPLSVTILGFHAQQACEKLLKALLTEHRVAYPRTHNLRLLSGLVEQHDGGLPAFDFPLSDLNDYAVPYRYDDPPPGFQRNASEMRAVIDALRAHVNARLKLLENQRQS